MSPLDASTESDEPCRADIPQTCTESDEPCPADIPRTSTESDEPRCADIARTNFNTEGIDVSGVPARLSWTGPGENKDNNHCLAHSSRDHLTLQIHRDASASTAFFQLKTHVALKARRDITHVYLSIYPERIRTVAVSESDESHDTAYKHLGTRSFELQFSLTRPPALVVPKCDLTPKHQDSMVVLDFLRAVVEQMSFSVYLPISPLSKARLVSLCESVTLGKLRSSPGFTDLASLYRGKGGRVIEHVPGAAVASSSTTPSPSLTDLASLYPGDTGGRVSEHAPKAAVASDSTPDAARVWRSPSHDELGMSSPDRLFATQKPRAKRRRVDTSSHVSKHARRQSMTMEMVCEMMMERMESGFNKLNSRLHHVEQRLTRLEICVEHHTEKLEVSLEDVRHCSSKQVDELRDELDNELYDVRRETEDTIDVRVEDEMYIARDQLEDFVKDEMTQIEERLEDKLEASLSNANISLDFSWNR